MKTTSHTHVQKQRFRFLLCVFLLLFPLCLCAAQEPAIKILNMQDGLPDNSVSCIHQDSDGFLWFGTNNGLCRWDGINTSRFSNEDTYLKIGHISESDNGNLWVIANYILHLFDRQRERFIPIQWQQTEPLISTLRLKNDSTAFLVGQGKLHAIEIHPIDRTHPYKGYQATVLYTLTREHFNSGSFQNMELLNDGTVLIATYNNELLWVEPNEQRLIKKVVWQGSGTTEVSELKYINNTVWLGTIAEGLYLYNIATDSFQHYTYNRIAEKSTLSHTDVYGIVPLPGRGVIVTTWNGYTVFYPKVLQPMEYDIQIMDHNTSTAMREWDSRILCGYCNADQILWMGSSGGGVVEMHLKKPFYKQLHQDSHNEVCQIALDNTGYLYLATFHRGILRSKHPFSTEEPLSLEEVAIFPQSLQKTPPTQTFRAVVKDTEGNLWFGGDKGIVVYYTTHAHQSRLVAGLPKSASVWTIFIDKQRRIWVGASTGLYLLNPATFTLSPYINNVSVRAITQDAQQDLWVGTLNGLYRYLPGFALKDNLFNQYESRFGIDAKNIRSLLVSKSGLLYVGYEDGLAVMDPLKDSLLTFYTTRNGLCSNFIGCLAQDKNGTIWVGSNSGISSYIEKEHLFNHFYISGNNRSVLAQDNDLIWGNNKSVTYFDTETLDNYTPLEPPKAHITDLEINHTAVRIGEKINGQVVLTQSITYTSRIKLNWRNYRFSVAFSDLSWREESTRFNYRLVPLERNWNMAQKGQTISYAHLKKGNYTLEVCAMAPNGALGECTRLQVDILPHWSRSLWAYAVYSVLCFLVVCLIYFRRQAARARKAREESLNLEIMRINREREQEQLIHQERVNFFSGISHELRTPLALILAPLHEMLHAKLLDSNMKGKLQLIQKNAETLSSTVDQFLLLQKMESGMVTLQLMDTDIVPLLKNIISSFSDLLLLKHLELTTHFDSTSIIVNIDVQKIESAIRNVLSNAIKYTPQYGEIAVSVCTKDVLGFSCCQIQVKDNGPGIKKEYIPHLFDSFITTNNEPTVSTKLGLGLKIVKNTMDLHHGKIDLETEEGKGACFTLSIPLGNAHFSQTEEVVDPLTERKPIQVLTNNKKLLLVEDHPDMHQYLTDLFSSTYTVFHAYNGEEGITQAQTHMPHIVVCDVMMPVKDGFTCSRELKTNPATSHIPIILLTARSEDADLIKGTQLGVDGYLMKPFNPEVLLAKVENLIRQRESLKRIYYKAFLTTGVNVQGTDPAENAFMQKIINIVEMNLSDPDFGVKTMAEMLCMSQPTLYRKIKANYQLSVIELIRKIRMSKAAAYLLEKKYSIQEVSERVGYSDAGTFRKHFMDQFGVSPSKF